MSDLVHWERTDIATQTELDAAQAGDAAARAALAADETGVHGISDFAKLTTAVESDLYVIRGAVNSAGAGSIIEGSGFTIVRNGVGDVTVNFSTAFAGTPAVLLGPSQTPSALVKMRDNTAPTAASFRVSVFLFNVGTALDGIFHFTAIGRR